MNHPHDEQDLAQPVQGNTNPNPLPYRLIPARQSPFDAYGVDPCKPWQRPPWKTYGHRCVPLVIETTYSTPTDP